MILVLMPFDIHITLSFWSVQMSCSCLQEMSTLWSLLHPDDYGLRVRKLVGAHQSECLFVRFNHIPTIGSRMIWNSRSLLCLGTSSTQLLRSAVIVCNTGNGKFIRWVLRRYRPLRIMRTENEVVAWEQDFRKRAMDSFAGCCSGHFGFPWLW